MAVYYMDGLHEIFQGSLYHHGQVVGQSNLGSLFEFLLHIVECRCPKASTWTMHHQLKIKSKVRRCTLARVLWLEIESGMEFIIRVFHVFLHSTSWNWRCSRIFYLCMTVSVL